MKRDRLPEKYATLRVITSNKDTTKHKKSEMNPMYKVGMLVRIRLRGVWRKAKIVDRTDAKILVVYKNDRGVFSEEWITPSARKEKKKNKQASKPCNSLGEKLSEMRKHEKTKSEKFNWRIQRWLDSSDGLSDEEDDEELKEKPQDMKCPEDHEDERVPRKRYPIDFSVRNFLTRDKKQQFTRRPNNNNAVESKIHSIPSPPKRPSFTSTFDRNLLEKIRVSERELRKQLNYHRYQ